MAVIEACHLVAQLVKNPPAVQETWVRSLGWEDPLKKGMATHSSILAWRTPWTGEPGGLHSMGSQRVGHDWATNTTMTVSETILFIFSLAYYYHLLLEYQLYRNRDLGFLFNFFISIVWAGSSVFMIYSVNIC